MCVWARGSSGGLARNACFFLFRGAWRGERGERGGRAHLRLGAPGEVQVFDLLLGGEQLLAELAVGALELGRAGAHRVDRLGRRLLLVEGALELLLRR